MQKLPTLRVPVRVIYGERDILLASEMRRLKQDLPRAHITAIPNCGHFLQEDQPERLSELLVKFFFIGGKEVKDYEGNKIGFEKRV